MITLKEYNTKLSRLKSTRKMTRTMKMVAANKLRKAQESHRRAAGYGQSLTSMVLRAGEGDPPLHPLTEPRRTVKNILILLVTSDRGLCGSFNNNLNRQVEQWVGRRGGQEQVQMSFCGRRGLMYFRNRATVVKHYEGVMAKASFGAVRGISRELEGMFLSGKVDEVYVAYNMFRSAMSRSAVVERLLPLGVTGPDGVKGVAEKS